MNEKTERLLNKYHLLKLRLMVVKQRGKTIGFNVDTYDVHINRVVNGEYSREMVAFIDQFIDGNLERALNIIQKTNKG